MGTKKNEENEVIEEITILSKEQIDALPEEAVEKVRSLSDGDLPAKQLQIFVPVVQKYIALRDKALKLKIEKDADGNITEESIEAYKEVKSDQRSFNGDLGREIKKIKDPLNSIKGDVLTVEKTFKAESDKIKEAAEKLFEEYENIKAEKAKAAQEKRDKELLDAVALANEEADKLKEQNSKTTIYNDIKIKRIAEGITEKATDGIFDANETTLGRIKAGIAQGTRENLVEGSEVDKLDEEIITELKSYYEKAKQRAIVMIDNKLTEYDNAREKELQDAVIQSKAQPGEMHVPAVGYNESAEHDDDIPEPPASIPVDLKVTDEAQFIEKVLNNIQALETAVNLRINEGPTPKLIALKNKFNAFNDAV